MQHLEIMSLTHFGHNSDAFSSGTKPGLHERVCYLYQRWDKRNIE